MTYAIGSDHGGYLLKEALKRHLLESGYDIVDYGTHNQEACDYPTYAKKVAEAVAGGKHSLGILVCGTGIGVSIAANKIPGIRAAAVSDHYSAKYTRLHNNANILCLGARVIGEGLAFELADVFLNTPFDGGRHTKRLDMISDIENEYLNNIERGK